jgi:peptidoglycan/LPS O-acetylase OafA/YrhL
MAADATMPATAEPDIASAQPGAEVTQAGERRLVRIESIRALAAIGVVAAHIWGFSSQGDFFTGLGARVLAGIGFGAFFFFALSGCLLYMPFARRDFGDGSSVSLKRYGLNRAVRIFPLYYISVVVVLLALYPGATIGLYGRFFLFLENFDPTTVGLYNGALWTIVIELHFYILLPLLAWAAARLAGRSVRGAAIVIGGLLLASVAFRVFAVIIPGRPFRDPVSMSLPANFYLIASGMLVALAREAWDRRPAWVRGALARADVWLLAAIPFWLAFVYDYKLQPLFAISCFLVLGAFVLPLQPTRVGGFLDWRPLAFLGLASYSLYIWQVPILEAIGRWNVPVIDPLITHVQDLLGSSYLGLMVVCMPLCIAAALLSFKLIEEPALRLRRRWGGYAGQTQHIKGIQP